MPSLIRHPSLRKPNENIVRHATWLELFFDLIFAVIITQLASRLFDHLTLDGIIKCIALLIPTFWVWASYTVFAARFDNNDTLHWTLTFIIMLAAAIMAIQIPTVLEGGATRFALGFVIAEIAMLLLYARVAYDEINTKKITVFYLFGFTLGGACWVLSLFFQPPLQYILWAIGMSIYLIAPWIGRKRILSEAPLDPDYIPERFGAFTIIIMGQIIASVVFGLVTANWNTTAVITAIMAFFLAIIMWGQYYRMVQAADYKNTLRTGQEYIYSHIPLIISLIVVSVCAEKFIKTPRISYVAMDIIFCLAAILWLASMHLLQYVAVCKVHTKKKSFLIAIAAIVLLFFIYPASSAIIMSGLTIIFFTLFVVQYRCKIKFMRTKT